MQAGRNNSRFTFFSTTLSPLVLCALSCFFGSVARAQEPAQEVSATLAEGRVVICAAKDGIVAATVATQSEPGSIAPTLAYLSATRMGVLLGAVEWMLPDFGDKPVRLDSEFPRLVGEALNTKGRNSAEGATDIESIGVAMLDRVRDLAGHLHRKIDVHEDEPLLRIVLIGYVQDYGPEAWTIDFHIRQDALGNDYWQTRVLRPTYKQLYPPEKGQPHTLLEVRFPTESRATQTPELLDLLRQNDPRLTQIRAANDATSKSIGFVVSGQSQKSMAAADLDFLRAALPATLPAGTAAKAQMSMANVDFDRGFQWVLQSAEAPPVDAKPQEPGAPTLRRKTTQ